MVENNEMMKQSSRKFPLNCLSCLFYFLKPHGVTIWNLFYTLFFKFVKYFWFIVIYYMETSLMMLV